MYVQCVEYAHDRWSHEDLEQLRAQYATSDPEDIARELKRSQGAIREQAKRLGLRRPPRPTPRSDRRWASDEVTKLRVLHARECHMEDVARALGRSWSSVVKKASQIGLRRR